MFIPIVLAKGQQEDVLKYSRIQNIPPTYCFPNKLHENPCVNNEVLTKMTIQEGENSMLFLNVYKC